MQQQTGAAEENAFVDSGSSPPPRDATKSVARRVERKFDLHTIDDLRRLPPPEWLIDDIIGLNTQAVLYGPPGKGKSFVALDMALSIASGTRWQSREVKQRAIVYVVAEGGRGIAARIEAWLKKRGVTELQNAFFLLEAPRIHKENDRNLLLKRIKSIQDLGLIVVDTLARSFVGGEENSAKELGEWIEGAAKVQRATGATVLTIHHMGKPGESRYQLERGSSSLRGAVDTMIQLTQDSQRVMSVKCTKQKDAEEFKPMKVRLDCFAINDAPKLVTSCVPVPADDKGEAPEHGVRPLSPEEQETLDALAKLGGAADSSSWREKTGRRERTFHNHRRALVDKGYVKEVEERPHWYAIAIRLPSAGQSTRPSEAAASASPLIGEAEAAEVAEREQQQAIT